MIVNRLWHHLFGRGLVATTDNFGRLGDPPTHPELLDDLATRFVTDGWSIKDGLVRLIVTAVEDLPDERFRASKLARSTPPCDPDEPAALLTHFPVRRLEARSHPRRGILAVSGRLGTKPCTARAFPAGAGGGASTSACNGTSWTRSSTSSTRRSP